MSVLVVGMSHRSAPVALLERLSMNDTVQNDTSTTLVKQPSLSEAMIISTCNRLEVYTVTNAFHTGVQDVVDVLAEVSGVSTEELRSYLYVRYADAAAEHMMSVASGLDSMVIGEQQIIGQVRTSYQEAQEQGTVGPGLHSLAQSALRAGKRVHTETEIDDAGGSMVTFAFDVAREEMGVEDFSGTTALVLGAGAMASLAATQLGKQGVDKLIIANRTRSRAERLAEHSREAGVPAEVVDFDARAGALSRVDLAVSATATDEFTITPEDISGPVMLVDLSLPRDIDDAVEDTEGVRLVNIEYLHARQEQEGDTDSSARRDAEAIIDEELAAYTSAERVRDVTPAVTQLRRTAAGLVDEEYAQLKNRLPHLDDDDLRQVARSMKRVVDKLLHKPTVMVKELAATEGTVSYETALQVLFGLPSAAPAVAVDVDKLPDREELDLSPETLGNSKEN
ncbi:glutamyl-tRNA reductase [Corynebacterium pilosum]|uniref:Glutamyl-tRNA reductase n=1 Tax=Corynebacterium pilosum TaxID=35756 RepID=A0A376CM09_9CORY|nr:glutamyl-tRNA reductase [Corynebacterium pilosum]STC69546.1 glutamyl-tRNA reductase [Corynebacterium pilosum]